LGNIAGIVIFSSKKLEKIGPIYILKYLLGSDAIYLLFLVFNYSAYTFNKDISKLSDIACKMYFYFNYALDPLSGMLLVYISIDRYVSIKYHTKRKFFRKHKTQFIYLLIIVLFNLCLYVPVLFYTELQQEANNETYCNWINPDIQSIALLVDTANRLILPFIAMLICDVLLIYTIYKSRRNMLTSNSRSNETLKKDIKFAVTSIFLNFVYILLNIPIILFFTLFSNANITFYYFTFYIWYLCYAVNFYLILFSNNLVRKEFFSKFKLNI
jgi:hypothetical protein